MSPVPTHWDPKHTDRQDGCHTVHCRHFNLALDSSRLRLIDRSKSYPVQLIRTTRQRESHSIINSQKAAKRNLTGRPLRLLLLRLPLLYFQGKGPPEGGGCFHE